MEIGTVGPDETPWLRKFLADVIYGAMEEGGADAEADAKLEAGTYIKHLVPADRLTFIGELIEGLATADRVEAAAKVLRRLNVPHVRRALALAALPGTTAPKVGEPNYTAAIRHLLAAPLPKGPLSEMRDRAIFDLESKLTETREDVPLGAPLVQAQRRINVLRGVAAEWEVVLKSGGMPDSDARRERTRRDLARMGVLDGYAAIDAENALKEVVLMRRALDDAAAALQSTGEGE